MHLAVARSLSTSVMCTFMYGFVSPVWRATKICDHDYDYFSLVGAEPVEIGSLEWPSRLGSIAPSLGLEPQLLYCTISLRYTHPLLAVFTVWVKNSPPPKVFWNFFPNGYEVFVQIFTNLWHVPMYAGIQIFTVRRYALHGLSYRNFVRPSVCPSVRHTRGLCPYGSTYDHDFFTIW